MLQSMTGFGRGEASNGDVSVVVELKSVNNRFRDVQVRCPREYLELETKIASVLKDAVQRGRIDVVVRRVSRSSATRVVADVGLVLQYTEVIRALAAQAGWKADAVEFGWILQQPGVLALAEADVDTSGEWDIVARALRAATDALVGMRRQEGEALRSELVSMLNEALGLIADIEQRVDGVNERLRARLEARLQRMNLEAVEPSRLAQEVGLLVDKSDVSEELFRLRSHCDRFRAALDEAEPVGRRLEFLLQEMNREVNTIGSKAVEHPVTDRVVELKSALERIREQSANVE